MGAFRAYIVGVDDTYDEELQDLLGDQNIEYTRYLKQSDFFLVCEDLPAGCVIIHASLERIDPVEVQRRIKRKCTVQHQIILLCGRCDVSAAVAAMREGAVDFLQKPFRYAEMLAALKSAEKRLLAMHSEKRAADQLRILQGTLTPKEIEVLQASSEGQSCKQVADQLGLSVRTVEMHRSHIIGKLDVKNFAGALVLAEAACLLNH